MNPLLVDVVILGSVIGLVWALWPLRSDIDAGADDDRL